MDLACYTMTSRIMVPVKVNVHLAKSGLGSGGKIERQQKFVGECKAERWLDLSMAVGTQFEWW